MRYSKLFGKTNKDAKTYESINATLLQKAGFIEQVMAGVYVFLPLGWRVLDKIEDIIREEMDTLGSELFLSTLSPKELWAKTGRLESIDVLMKAVPANEVAKERHNGEYIVNPTHEDLITHIASHYSVSYRDLPFAVYQIQTKFRNEPRAKSGLLRGREFRMKDLYSFHTSEEDFKAFYEKAKDVYKQVFDRLGLGTDTYLTMASGGDFTKEYSHEFQTVCATGEDTIFIDETAGVAYNKEVAPTDTAKLREERACEVGNIFPLGTRFSQALDYYYTDEHGQRQLVWMGSYGIGSSRAMGVIVEKYNDGKGIIWPESVAPYRVHLIGLNFENDEVRGRVEKFYQQLTDEKIDVLFDDRSDVSAGAKFADADLIGIPWRVVISAKTGDKIEVKRRGEDQAAVITPQEFTARLV